MKQGQFSRILSLLLVLVTILQVGPFATIAAATPADFIESGLNSVISSAGEESAPTADEYNLSSNVPPTVVEEEEGLRTEDGKHFRLSDGSYISVSYGMPVHYADENGEWQDIDNTLQLMNSRRESAMYAAENGASAVSFSENLSDGRLFTTTYGQQSVSMSLMDSTIQAQDNGQTETIPAVAENSVPSDAVTEPTEIVEETVAAIEDVSGSTEYTETVISTETGTDESTSETEAVEDSKPVPMETESVVPENTEIQETIVAETETIASVNLPEAEPVPDAEAEQNSSNPAASSAMKPDKNEKVFNRLAEAQVMTDMPMTLSAKADNNQQMMDAVFPKTLNSTVLYENVFQGVDLVYNVSGYNIKESVVVKEPLEQYRFSFRLDLDGLTPELQEDGSVTLTNAEGTVVYLIPAPYLFDQANRASDAAKYELTESDKGYILTVEADAAWMNDAERSYPITIDPTLFLYAGTAKDDIYATYVEEGHPTTDHGHYQDLYFGCTDTDNAKERQIYMHFNKLPELPAGSVVVHSSLNLWMFDYSHVGWEQMPIGLYEVTGNKPAKYSDYHDWIYYMDWNSKPAYDSSNMIDYTIASRAVDDSYLTWELTELVNKWYNENTENRTIALAATERGNYSYDHCAVPVFYAYGRRHPPILVISYRNNTGIEPYYTYQTMGAGHAGTAYISDFSNQLTVAKELITFASTSSPFSLQMVFNSAYFSKGTESQYDLAKDIGLDMHVGSGCTYNIIQHVKKETIDGIEYIRYLDGDGTIHYFAKNPEMDKKTQQETGASELIEYYYDEDGLGLKINEYAPEFYSMTDDKGNELVFVHGPLLWMKDSDGNKIIVCYSKNGVMTNGYPTGSGDRVEKITRKNNRAPEVDIATFKYKTHTPNKTEVSNYLSTITDCAGNVYSFDYQSGKLTSIKYNNKEIARYTMRRGSTGWYQNELVEMTDVEAGYGLKFSYKNHRVSAVQEVADGNPGAKIEISKSDDRHTTYRDLGADRTSGTSDDIITNYGFDYVGRTVNAYTTDSKGTILGATNAAYSGTGTTDRTNNRTMRTATIGMSGQQELRNFGFEFTAPELAWQIHKSGGNSTTTVNAVINGDNTRTGGKSFKTWITPGKPGLAGTSKKSNLLQANRTYILSAYVNTSQSRAFAGKGMYLQVKDTAGNTWKSTCLNYKTSNLVDNGWVRMVLVFQTKTKCEHTISIYNDGVGGVVYADDVQVEEAKAPVEINDLPNTQAVTNVNLLENGNMQHWRYGWKNQNDKEARFVTHCGVNSTNEYAYSIRVDGNPTQDHYAYQTVTLNQPSSQTYVLSGWAKANSVPDNKIDGDPEKDKEAEAKDKNKQFGLRAVLTYANGGGTEYHYAPFNPDLNSWQFTSLTIVPKQANKTVESIKVECAYEKNANAAWFDDISLVKEVAQAMRYDDKGNLVSVTTTNIKEDVDTYENGNLIKKVTGGNGTYTYTYDSNNKHRLNSVTNDVVTQNMSYDTYGNATGTTLKSNKNDYVKTMNTSATYDSTGNLMTSLTDSSGQKVSYTYGNKQSIMTGQPTTVKDANGTTTTTAYDNMGRISESRFANGGVLRYNYNKGLLAGVQREAEPGKQQSIACSYDAFGNLSAVDVGGIRLTSYQYAAKNGNLLKEISGNGSVIAYKYDHLDRIVQTTYSSGRVLTYTYTGDGQIYSITDNGTTSGNATDDTVYYYTYDTLNRIINCQVCRGIQVLIQTHLEYDDYNRLKSQGWQMGTASYKESYTYSEKDGTLTSITTDGSTNTLRLAYDSLERLTSVDNGIYKRSYTYRDINSAQTTGQIKKIQYSGLQGPLNNLSYDYTYDVLGNITSIVEGTKAKETYSYDSLGQLTQAHLPERHLDFTYTYDKAGNLQKVESKNTAHSSESYANTYTYGNSSWGDLLTGFNQQPIWYEGQSLSPDGTISGVPKSGNPIGYFNGTHWNFQWDEGRNLTEATTSTDDTETSLTFAYDASGLRTKKTVVTKTYETVADHDYVTSVVASTCTKAGYTQHKCTYCGDTYKTDEVEPLGHDFVEIKGSGSLRKFQCTRCGYIMEDKEVPIVPPIDPDRPVVQKQDVSEAASDCTNTKRVLKSTVTEEHDYIHAGGKLQRETITSNGHTRTLDFQYDDVGRPYALIDYNGDAVTTYYYITNLQGDVMYLVDGAGKQVAEYVYDPYGKILSAKGDMAEINPLRYRGYYYDNETNFYYLESRYYDPSICRFINADVFASTGQGLMGCNMFAYCLNNPIAYMDEEGTGSIWAILFADKCFGFIHTKVQQHIATKYINQHIEIETGDKRGRADVVRGTAVWEIKTEKTGAAAALKQAMKYIGMHCNKTGETITELGEAGAFNGEFFINYPGGVCMVKYHTPEAGVILYSVQELGEEMPEYAMEYAPVYEYERKKNVQVKHANIPSGGAILAYGLGSVGILWGIGGGVGGGHKCGEPFISNMLM